MHGNQRRRTGRLHVDAWPGQVEFVRDSRARKILVVAEMCEAARGARQIRAEGQSIDKIAAHDSAKSREDSDRPGRASNRFSGVLESLPRDFQKQPLLRIHEPRFLRRIFEEGSIELVDSTPSHRFCQKAEWSRAPGKRQAMPTIATPAEVLPPIIFAFSALA